MFAFDVKETSLEDVREYFDAYYHVRGFEEEKEELWQCLLISMATLVANKFAHKPVWVVFVAPAGTGKTTILSFLFSLERNIHVRIITGATMNAFISGAPKRDEDDDVGDLSEELKSGCTMIFPEFASFLTGTDAEIRMKMRSLVSIWDGIFSRESPLIGRKEFPEHIGLLGAMTPGTEESSKKHLAEIGSRYMTCKFPVISDDYSEELSRKNKMNEGKREAALRKAVKDFLTPVLNRVGNIDFEENDEETEKELQLLSRYMRFVRNEGMPSRVRQQMEYLMHAYDYVINNSRKILPDTVDLVGRYFVTDRAARDAHLIVKAIMLNGWKPMTIKEIHESLSTEIDRYNKNNVSWTRNRCAQLKRINVIEEKRHGRKYYYKISESFVKIFEKFYPEWVITPYISEEEKRGFMLSWQENIG